MNFWRLLLVFAAASFVSATTVHYEPVSATHAANIYPGYVFRALSDVDYRRYSEKKSIVPWCNPEFTLSKSIDMRHVCQNGGDCCVCHISGHSRGLSSFISTTKDLEIAEYFNRSKRRGIIMINLSKLPSATLVIDMTEERNRKTHLVPSNDPHLPIAHEKCWLDAVRHVSIKDKEVLIKGEIPREAYEFLL
jgi:hypothetical protein